MKLIEEILEIRNIKEAIKQVKSNKGAAGVDKMTVDEIDSYFSNHYEDIVNQIMEKKYIPSSVRRVYIPKANGKKRPLGIPVVADRVIQQAIAQKLSLIYDNTFSEYSYGFRPNRNCHMAITKALEYINEGYNYIIDFDIEKYFDTVNHDKLISMLREKVFDSATLHLIRKFLQAGVMEDGLINPTDEGVPQGGPLSPLLANIYLDKLDKELEYRGLRFARYADDFIIFTKSNKSAKRVKESVTSWIERKLFLKVSEEKTKIVRPNSSEFLGFAFWNKEHVWRARPLDSRKQRLMNKIKVVLTRRKAIARPLSESFRKVNQIVIGWINYYRIGDMRIFIQRFGEWLRHKIRVIMIKQWKKPKTICINLTKINRFNKTNFTEAEIYSVSNARQGLYRLTNHRLINFIITPKVLETPNKKKDRPGLVNPLNYYLKARCNLNVVFVAPYTRTVRTVQ